MRLQLSTAILALLPLAMCNPFGNPFGKHSADVTNIDASTALDTRGVAASGDTFFQVNSFEAFMPTPARIRAGDYSRASFDVTLMHPDLDKRWTVTCWAHTRENTTKLCNSLQWRECTTVPDVPGSGNVDEQLFFKFGPRLSSVDIKRRWTHQGMTMTAMASEPATWSESVNPNVGNVTVGQYGKCYKKASGWVFPWQTIVG